MPKQSLIFFYLAISVLWSCSKGKLIAPNAGQGPDQGPVVVPVTPTAIGKTYLALGDSYTIGQGVAASERFAIQTRSWLQNNGVNMVDPQFVAGPDWTTYVLQNQMGNRPLGHGFDIVSLLIGVNDQYIGRDSAAYRETFTQLLEQAIYIAGDRPTHVFVLSIPDYSVTPSALNLDTARIRKEIDAYNFINKQVALQHKVFYLDITPSTRMAKTDATLLVADGLHPSGIEYKKWADQLGPMMKSVLQ